LTANYKEILNFWFVETPRDRHYGSDPAFDAEIRERFAETWRAGREGRLMHWEDGAEGALALVLLFDQLPRNMFRGSGDAFSTDALALGVARRAVARDFDRDVGEERQSFFYMPFMHSEDLDDQEECIRLFRERKGSQVEENSYAVRHRNAIARFGRFPARNKALGRETTEEEAAFLREKPSGF
jgi:uncharacterized protein (DUF924 family)